MGAGPGQQVLRIGQPALHDLRRDFGVELDAVGLGAIAEGLVREGLAAGQQGCALRQLEALAVPVIDVGEGAGETG